MTVPPLRARKLDKIAIKKQTLAALEERKVKAVWGVSMIYPHVLNRGGRMVRSPDRQRIHSYPSAAIVDAPVIRRRSWNREA